MTNVFSLAAFLWFGSTRKDWQGIRMMNAYFAKQLRFLRLLLKVTFCNEPARTNQETMAVK